MVTFFVYMNQYGLKDEQKLVKIFMKIDQMKTVFSEIILIEYLPILCRYFSLKNI